MTKGEPASRPDANPNDENVVSILITRVLDQETELNPTNRYALNTLRILLKENKVTFNAPAELAIIRNVFIKSGLKSFYNSEHGLRFAINPLNRMKLVFEAIGHDSGIDTRTIDEELRETIGTFSAAEFGQQTWGPLADHFGKTLANMVDHKDLILPPTQYGALAWAFGMER